MGTTTRGYRYPATNVAPDVPLYIQNLASDVDADISALFQARQALRTTPLNVPDSTFQPVITYDGGATYNVGSIGYSSGVFTVGVAGLYRWSSTVIWPATSTTPHNRQHLLYKNGTEVPYQSGRNSWTYYGSTQTETHSTGGDVVLAVGDQVQAYLYHTFGSFLTVNPTLFTLTRIG